MYVITGKGSVAGVDLADCILSKCQKNGVLWDSDLPEYTLDFATQIPPLPKDPPEESVKNVIDALNTRLQHAEAEHEEYILLCMPAQKLLSELHTKMQCVALWDEVNPYLERTIGPIGLLGTLESLPENDQRFVTLSDHADCIGDLITSVKRGYAQLGENYSAHPRHLLANIIERFRQAGVVHFFVGCTDLHICKQYLTELGIAESAITDVIDITAQAIIGRSGLKYEADYLDAASNARMALRYKYLTHSDSPQTEKKTTQLDCLINALPRSTGKETRILDIGGGSKGDSIRVSHQLTDKSSHITLLDISSASLNAARPTYDDLSNITTNYVCGSLETFVTDDRFDAILCLGVLLCISNDAAFKESVEKIARLMKPDALLITRDCLGTARDKKYMAFGGVIRNRDMYNAAFNLAGLQILDANEFVIDKPIERSIVTTVWTKC